MQPSRRAFLLGRRPPQTPWAEFCARISRLCEGALQDGGESGGVGRATLVPATGADVRVARALCAQYGVLLRLADVPGARLPADLSVLVVDPGALRGLEKLVDGRVPLWRAAPGCRVEDLAQAGLPQFAAAPRGQTLAAWLAGSAAASCPPGGCAALGVRALDVLLADGVVETLGPFGERDQRPLRSATVQRLVPALFQLAQGDEARACRAQAVWPARLRLDALLPAPPHAVNLAHLLCGHGGALAWVEGALLAPGEPLAVLPQPGAVETAPGLPASRLDLRVKAAFDPQGVFPSVPAHAWAGALAE